MATATWRLKKGATWSQKLHAAHPSHGKVVDASAAQRRTGIRTLVIPRPLEVQAAVRKVPKGKLITVGQLRDRLADASGADAACPLTTGIFLRMVAEAAEESRAEGKKRITPYWRVIDDNGGLKAKFPGGPSAQAKQLRAEGHVISPARGKQTPRVKDFAAALVR